MTILIKYYTHDAPSKPWFSIREFEQSELEEDLISPWDSQVADFARKAIPFDTCSIELFPAWNKDSENDLQSLRNKDEYFLILHHQNLARPIHSYLPYAWNEAIKLAELFRNQSLKASLRIWKAKKIGRTPIETKQTSTL